MMMMISNNEMIEPHTSPVPHSSFFVSRFFDDSRSRFADLMNGARLWRRSDERFIGRRRSIIYVQKLTKCRDAVGIFR